jgi:hypothetical protein
MENNEPVRLAYEASIRAIADQASVLESMRSRAGTMLAAAAIVTSFFGGQAIDAQTHFDYSSTIGLAVAAFVAAALLTIVILWPFSFRFSLSARDILAIVDARATTAPVTPEEAHRELALRLEFNYDHNSPRIQALIWCFRGAILCLVMEVGAWIAALGEIG